MHSFLGNSYPKFAHSIPRRPISLSLYTQGHRRVSEDSNLVAERSPHTPPTRLKGARQRNFSFFSSCGSREARNFSHNTAARTQGGQAQLAIGRETKAMDLFRLDIDHAISLFIRAHLAQDSTKKRAAEAAPKTLQKPCTVACQQEGRRSCLTAIGAAYRRTKPTAASSRSRFP